jgi:GntR family transcriptional regulator
VSKRDGTKSSESTQGLQLAVDRTAEIPIGTQLAWALRTRIASGALAPGERLPGLRELAKQTGVNVNTVRAVYQRLEQDGLLDSQQGSGTFVASRPPNPSAAASIAADAAREAHETGVDPREVAAALYVTPAQARRPRSDTADRRRALREQIASLERTLGELEAKQPMLAPAVEVSSASGPALLSADELEEVRARLVRRLSTVQAAIDALGQDASGAEPRRADQSKARSRRKSEKQAGARPRPAPAGA